MQCESQALTTQSDLLRKQRWPNNNLRTDTIRFGELKRLHVTARKERMISTEEAVQIKDNCDTSDEYAAGYLELPGNAPPIILGSGTFTDCVALIQKHAKSNASTAPQGAAWYIQRWREQALS